MEKSHLTEHTHNRLWNIMVHVVYFAGPFMDRMFLLLVAAHSKWGEVIDMAKSTPVTSAMVALQHHFVAYGFTEHVRQWSTVHL